jgi:membrane fusion protein, multidrug efflux system
MRYLYAILSLLAVLGTLAAVKASQISMLIGAGAAMQKAGPPPETVTLARVQHQNWEQVLNSVGTVTAAKGVALSVDVSGIVTRLHFESGSVVKRGDVLVELDSSIERAQLASLKARRDLAESSLKRTRALVDSGAIAPVMLDTDEASYRGLVADFAALEAQIAHKFVRAPFGGKLGIRAVNLGQFLAPGAAIASLESTDACYVDFALPQQHAKQLQRGMPVRIMPTSGGTDSIEGSLAAVAPELDAATRNIKLRASMPKTPDQLRPGMFVKVAVVLPEKHELLTVPTTSIVHATYGDSVFCADERTPSAPGGKPSLVARQQFVKLGETRGDFVSVLDGLHAGEAVVVAGAFKLRNGIPLVANDEVKLNPQIDPHPVNR